MTRHWLHSSPRKKEECAISFFAPCFLRALLLPRFDIVRTNEVFWCYSKFLTGASRLARSVLNSRAFCLTHKRSLLSLLFESLFFPSSGHPRKNEDTIWGLFSACRNGAGKGQEKM